MDSRYQQTILEGLGRFEGLMSLHDAAIEWGVDDSSVRKAISVGRFTIGIDAQKFGKQWVVTREAMAREFSARRAIRQLSAEIRAERERKDRMESMMWPD